VALLSILFATLGGQALGSVLAGLSVAQWVAVANDLVGAAPLFINLIGGAHQALAEVITHLNQGHPPEVAGQAGHDVIHGPQYHGGPKTGV
jgi:hypothetical protein